MINVAGYEKESYTDGIGIRYTVFTQGCKHNCIGCHNPQTHSFDTVELVEIADIIEDIKENEMLDGITLSGGDPFYQAEECAKLAKRVKEELKLNVWAYTGFVMEELLKSSDASIQELLKYIDVIVDGPFIINKRQLALRFRGSSNQRFIDVKKSLQANNIVLYNVAE